MPTADAPAAAHSPEVISQHGLTAAEYAKITKALGRHPNLLELGVFSAMWSEHCSYQVVARPPRDLANQRSARPARSRRERRPWSTSAMASPWLSRWRATTTPSFIEPKQGAATGVGGILRDVFTMGARPIASLNLLRFGEPSHPKTPFLVAGVVAGIGGYGNSVGGADRWR